MYPKTLFHPLPVNVVRAMMVKPMHTPCTHVASNTILHCFFANHVASNTILPCFFANHLASHLASHLCHSPSSLPCFFANHLSSHLASHLSWVVLSLVSLSIIPPPAPLLLNAFLPSAPSSGPLSLTRVPVFLCFMWLAQTQTALPTRLRGIPNVFLM